MQAFLNQTSSLLSRNIIIFLMFEFIAISSAAIPRIKEEEIVIESPIPGESAVMLTGSLEKNIESAKHYPMHAYEVGRANPMGLGRGLWINS
jgi:hypothetical protein